MVTGGSLKCTYICMNLGICSFIDLCGCVHKMLPNTLNCVTSGAGSSGCGERRLSFYSLYLFTQCIYFYAHLLLFKLLKVLQHGKARHPQAEPQAPEEEDGSSPLAPPYFSSQSQAHGCWEHLSWGCATCLLS